MIVCPILSQARRAEDGSVTWEHHECLRDECSFWAAEAQDCGVRTSSLQVLRDAAARANETPAAPPDPSAILEKPLARLDEIEKKIEEVAERSAAASREMGIRLLEGVSALEQPVQALRAEVEQIAGRLRDFAAVTERASVLIEDQGRREEERRREKALEEARACNGRGLALFHTGAHEAAEAAFRRAAELDPSMAEAHNNLGLALSRQGRTEEAAAAFEKALEIRPDLASALNNMGFLCHESMEFEKAVDLFRRAALSGSDASVALTNLGNALYRLDRKAEAVEAWRSAVEKDPLNENASRALRMFEGAEVNG